jgi:hypothetical protein
MVKTVIMMVDKMIPGQKTYALMAIGMAMMVCQMMGYHSFSSEAWGMMGVGGAATWKMGMDRDK